MTDDTCTLDYISGDQWAQRKTHWMAANTTAAASSANVEIASSPWSIVVERRRSERRVQDTAQPIRRSRGVSLSDGCSSPYSSAARRTTSVLYHGISLFLSFNVIAEVGTMLSLFTTSITMPFFDFSVCVCVCVRACVRVCVLTVFLLH